MNKFYRKPKPETMKKNREFYKENFKKEIAWFKENLEEIKEDKDSYEWQKRNLKAALDPDPIDPTMYKGDDD